MPKLPSGILRHLLGFELASAATTAVPLRQISAILLWDWSYSGKGITASGTLTTIGTPDDSGFYLITGITGMRNGETITGLQAIGTSIPGNEPYTVDNLISADPQRQLTGNGFGFSTAAGNYSSPFFADFSQPPGYLEFFSAPPFTGGAGKGDCELPISFSAKRRT